MKVLHVIGAYYPEEVGGAQLYLRNVANGQAEDGLTVAVLCRDPEAPVRPDRSPCRITRYAREVDGIPVHTYPRRDPGSARTLLESIRDPAFDLAFDRLLAEEAYDVVHFHHLHDVSLGALQVSSRRARCTALYLQDYWLSCPRGQRFHPKSWEVCDPIDRKTCAECLYLQAPPEAPAPTKHPQIAAWERSVRQAMTRCDLVLAPSEWHLRHFHEAGYPTTKGHVVPLGIDPALLSARRPHRWPIRRIGYIGTVIPSKGVHTLVEAFRYLEDPDLRLDVYGPIAPFHEMSAEEYRRQLQELCEGENRPVTFHGRYEPEALPSILEELDLLVVPSIWWESYCITAREAAAAGIPVIAVPTGGLEEAVQSGYVRAFRPGDPRDLANQIETLCSDQGLVESLLDAGKSIRTTAECASEIRELYAHVLEDSSRYPTTGSDAERPS